MKVELVRVRVCVRLYARVQAFVPATTHTHTRTHINSIRFDSIRFDIFGKPAIIQ